MAAIGKVVVQLWRHTFTGRLPQDFLSSLTQDAQRRRHERSFARTGVHYRVAVDGSEVIGFASGGPSRDPNFTEQNELYAIFLMPDFERRGIGGRLFYSVISEFVSSERQGLYLTALAANPNREFYTKLGGIEVDGPSIQLGEDNHPQVAFLWAKLPSVTDCERP